MTSKDEPSEEEHGHVSATEEEAHSATQAAKTSTASAVAIAVNLTSMYTSVTGLTLSGLGLHKQTPNPNSLPPSKF